MKRRTASHRLFIIAMSTEKKTPTDFIKSVYGRPVIVKLFSGVVYKGEWFLSQLTGVGVLGCLDGFLNVVMEQAEEYVDGKYSSRYSDCFIRGNNSRFDWVG